jgi:hypothetical protein
MEVSGQLHIPGALTLRYPLDRRMGGASRVGLVARHYTYWAIPAPHFRGSTTPQVTNHQLIEFERPNRLDVISQKFATMAENNLNSLPVLSLDIVHYTHGVSWPPTVATNTEIKMASLSV